MAQTGEVINTVKYNFFAPIADFILVNVFTIDGPEIFMWRVSICKVILLGILRSLSQRLFIER